MFSRFSSRLPKTGTPSIRLWLERKLLKPQKRLKHLVKVNEEGSNAPFINIYEISITKYVCGTRRLRCAVPTLYRFNSNLSRFALNMSDGTSRQISFLFCGVFKTHRHESAIFRVIPFRGN